MVDYYRQHGKRQIAPFEEVAETMSKPVHLAPEQRALAGATPSISPLVLGQRKQFFRRSEAVALRLVAAKNVSQGLVKLTYEPRP